MTLEVWIVFGLLAAAVPLFAWERISFDVVALIILSVLLTAGILTPDEGFSGFANPATVTIAAMFVLSEGLRRTGALDRAGELFHRLGRHDRRRAVISIMATVAVLSAFINNTAAVAIFIPIVLRVSAELRISPSKLLIPLSFAAMFGGGCTLIGTSTNILISSVAEDAGLAPFGMFEFAPLGLILLAVGFVYLLVVGIPLLPERRSQGDLASGFEMDQYLTEVVVGRGFSQLGEPFDRERLADELDVDVLLHAKGGEEVEAERGGHDRRGGEEERVLEVGDVLRVRGGAPQLDRLRARGDFSFKPPREWYDRDLAESDERLVEAVIAPDSPIEGQRIREVHFPERFGAVLLGIRHHGELREARLAEQRLAGGDSLLMCLPADRVTELRRERSFVLVSEVGLERRRGERMPVAIAILLAVVGIAAAGLMPIVVTATVGSLLMVLTGCLDVGEAYQAISWKVIFLLAGILPLGVAMEKTGAARILSDGVLWAVGDLGPMAVLSGFFLLSMALTNVISNQATAVLLAPIAIQSASALGVEVRPLLVAVTYAASLSFITPVGYQTNTLVYGPGHYRFGDFVRVGTPLDAVIWILATVLIPLFWPL